jgi:hypothetical protein
MKMGRRTSCRETPYGGSCVIRTSSIHKGLRGKFCQYPHLCPHVKKCAKFSASVPSLSESEKWEFEAMS